MLRTLFTEGARLPAKRPDPVPADAERAGREPSGKSRTDTGRAAAVESEPPDGLASRGARETSWRSRPRAMNPVEERGLFKAAHERRTAMRLQRTPLREGSSHGMGMSPDTTTQGMFLASIGFRIQPHKRDEVLSAVDETVRRMRQASGCARSRLMADADDPNAFTVLSEWQSADTADVFFSSRDFQIFKGIRILLRDEPVMVLDDVRSRVTRLLRGQ
jgi:quinol monooxygenase YgiN